MQLEALPEPMNWELYIDMYYADPKIAPHRHRFESPDRHGQSVRLPFSLLCFTLLMPNRQHVTTIG